MKNAVLVVDYQSDFADPKGGLYVKDGEKIKQSINEFLEQVKDKATIIASRDWHPKNHCSFVENGGQWNTHCVQNTDGAKLYFDPKYDLSPSGERLSSNKFVKLNAYFF